MWQTTRVVRSGPWQVGIGFAETEVARAFDDVFGHDRLDDADVGIAFGAATRPGTGTTWFHGHLPLLRCTSVESLIAGMAWTLAGLADARLGVTATTDLRVLVGDAGVVLLDAARPELLATRTWRAAGLVELPLVRVRVDADAGEIVLPAPPREVLGPQSRWAGLRLPVRGVVARGLVGEMREETAARLAARSGASGSERLVESAMEAGRLRTATTRSRLADHALRLLRS